MGPDVMDPEHAKRDEDDDAQTWDPSGPPGGDDGPPGNPFKPAPAPVPMPAPAPPAPPAAAPTPADADAAAKPADDAALREVFGHVADES